jgi:hypothetical protein
MKALLTVEAAVLLALSTLALDLYAHRRVQMLGGVNVWGYRGAVAQQKAPREIRVTVVGGTRAFAWGQGANALTAEIRRRMLLSLDRPGLPVQPVSVINLAKVGALPNAYAGAIEHYAYLSPDAVCIYDDLNVAAGTPIRSAMFDATGYAPALPLLLREKGMRWRFGDVARGYGEPSHDRATQSAVARFAGAMVEGVGATLQAIDTSLARVSPESKLTDYPTALVRSVHAAHQRSRGVVLAFSVAETVAQRSARSAAQEALTRAFGSPAWLRVIDLDGDERLIDPVWRVDGWNYGGTAIALVAERLASELLLLVDVRPS